MYSLSPWYLYKWNLFLRYVALRLHANCNITENLFPQCQGKIMCFSLVALWKSSSITCITHSSCHINRPDPVFSIQTRYACCYEELQHISGRSQMDSFTPVSFHSHLGRGWGWGGCRAGSHGADRCETGYSRVSKNSPASVCHRPDHELSVRSPLGEGVRASFQEGMGSALFLQGPPPHAEKSREW